VVSLASEGMGVFSEGQRRSDQKDASDLKIGLPFQGRRKDGPWSERVALGSGWARPSACSTQDFLIVHTSPAGYPLKCGERIFYHHTNCSQFEGTTMKTNASEGPKTRERMNPSSNLSRRKFIQTGAAVTAFTIVPRHVLGGQGFVPPSEKITVAYIGCGTQGTREMLRMLAMPEVQIVAVCDPVKDGRDYVDFTRDGLRTAIAQALGKPDWRKGAPIPGDGKLRRKLSRRFMPGNGRRKSSRAARRIPIFESFSRRKRT
jgi:hypothetical protein